MSRAQRKLDHVQHAISTGQSRCHGFQDISFVHQSLPNTALQDVCLKTQIGELFLSSPILINAMTGGGGEQTEKINEGLALAAHHHGIAMAVGSQMAALKDMNEKKSFQVVRKVNPDGIVFANLGSEATIEQANRAVSMLEANAIQIHLNVIQELTMPEGDRDFTGALRRIETIVQQCDVPVIVKEVGFGMGQETIRSLEEIGVTIIDVGGFGGTNFANIENARRTRVLSYFNEWGIPTAASIAEAYSTGKTASFIASGGVQTALDCAKALALGASAAAFAGYFLKILLNEGIEPLIKEIGLIHEDLKIMMTALGATTVSDMHQVPLVITGETYHWLQQRGIQTTGFSQRKAMQR
ncbi:type 2 isopentenyl-diphosphate Delta-isomerase [Bacillus sp. 165]|uniref:type 2 isopentenyl-diphosphate Delta-isomerase n=1 Tax=Bacillus sp. 165 TaxID=1529117 RepID=UPI001ADA51BC|nr:type 2 isopentenyl-diphosphate Delta-isomerase [Bacillus sp. 165]